MSTNWALSTLFGVPTRNTHDACGCESNLYPSSIQESMRRLDLSNQLTITSLSPIFEGTYSDIYKGYYQGHEASTCLCGSSISNRVQVAIKSIRAVKDTEGMQMVCFIVVCENFIRESSSRCVCLGSHGLSPNGAGNNFYTVRPPVLHYDERTRADRVSANDNNRFSKFSGSQFLQKIQHLVSTLWPLSHPNVLPCYGYAETKGFGDYGAIISHVST
jgi:hypothetical protein